MPKLVPINRSCFFGVPINTINPLQKAIYFMKPPLGKRGNALREARAKYDEIKKSGIQQQEKQEDFQKRLQEQGIKILIESAKLQYYVDYSDLEKDSVIDENQLFREEIENNFLDGDIDRILFSIDMGKEVSFLEQFEIIKNQKELIHLLGNEEKN